MDEPRVIFIEIPTMNKSRSVSPVSPSMYRDKNTGFFDMLSRRFGRRSHDELYFSQNEREEDTRSSSTESCSSTSVQLAGRNDGLNKTCVEPLPSSNKQRHYIRNCSCESHSSSASSSDSVENTTPNGLNVHRRSTSSIRRAMQNLSISTRSLSCSSTGRDQKDQKAKKTKKPPPQPKCILRQPISYTYLKGISGLPTKRVPTSSICCYYPTHR
ncbi:uncharacterized protein LOC116345841 [Contarinia nasturtii]|uniref:uncharacterized protein LOC116345841 n=1 Tax=Contarinia nasturtii TaxID=265458 RepID=UPI0012D4B475|nr:uncharacterized protein LOC116345841 [Contarinia nasturtii]